MNSDQAYQEILRLIEVINYHNHLYYVQSRSEISDFELENYDPHPHIKAEVAV